MLPKRSNCARELFLNSLDEQLKVYLSADPIDCKDEG
jgi:hypothetical protein